MNAAVDIDEAIVRYVERHQPVPFGELAEYFVDAPSHAPVTESALATLHARLGQLCAAGRLARLRAPRLNRRGTHRRRGRYIVPAGVHAATLTPAR